MTNAESSIDIGTAIALNFHAQKHTQTWYNRLKKVVPLFQLTHTWVRFYGIMCVHDFFLVGARPGARAPGVGALVGAQLRFSSRSATRSATPKIQPERDRSATPNFAGALILCIQLRIFIFMSKIYVFTRALALRQKSELRSGRAPAEFSELRSGSRSRSNALVFS